MNNFVKLPIDLFKNQTYSINKMNDTFINEHQARLLLEAVAKGIKLTKWEEEQLAIFLATH